MIRLLVLILCVQLSYLPTANAQPPFGDSDGISSVGTQLLKLKPSRLRLVMWVEAKGSDPKAAVTSLNAHKTRVQTELEAMKADASSIRFTATQLSTGGADPNQQQRMRYMQEQMREQGNEMELPTVHTARAALSAEWALPVQEGDALALLPATLQEQIDKRDFAGKNNTPKLDAQAQEKMEELQAMMEDQYGGYYDSSESGTVPTIYFVASIPPDEVKQSVAKAFELAASKAKLLAEAAGAQLGKLKSVRTASSDDMSAYAASMDPYAYSPYGRGMSGLPAELVRSNESTVVSPSIDNLQVNIGVIVTYSLE